MNLHLEAFENHAHDLQSMQQLVLSQIVESLCASDYGRHHLVQAAMTPGQFVMQLPLVQYEDVRTWVERIDSAQSQSLTAERTIAFFKTSGSTAKPKMVPVTASLMRQKVAAFSTFWGLVYRDYPEIATGSMVSNFIDAGESSRLESGLELCSESSFWSRRGRGMHSLQRWPLPAQLRLVKDTQARLYAVARLLLQSPLHCIMCLNPSTLLQFCRLLHEHAPQLVEGLRTGTWGTEDALTIKHLDVRANGSLASFLKIDAEAADRLSNAMSGTTHIKLNALWPMLQLIICWRSRIVQPYFVQLAPWLGGLPVRDYISQSSECIMSIPVRDEVSGGALAYTSHFFEFIAEADVDASQPETLFAWQLDADARYELVVTTGGGLYRYRTGDCVRVAGFWQGVPDIEFLYRFGKTSSITGEKLTEQHVLHAATRATEKTGFQPSEFLCYPCSGSLPHYALMIDSGCERRELTIDAQQELAWVRAFEQALGNANPEYQDKCASGRLGPIALYHVHRDALSLERVRKKSALVSDEQVKSEVLTSKLDCHKGIASATLIV